MMSVVDWDPMFTGPPQKSLVEPLHSLAVHFERSAGKDVKQKHKPSCNIKKMDKFINLRFVTGFSRERLVILRVHDEWPNDESKASVINLLLIFSKFIGDIVRGPRTRPGVFTESP